MDRFPRSIVIAAIVTMCVLVGAASSQPTLAQLRVIRARKMAGAEHGAGTSNNQRAKYAVRFRLELSGKQGAYILLVGPKGAAPLGFARKKIAERSCGTTPLMVLDHAKSHGVGRLTHEVGAEWVSLPPSAVYELEVESESKAGIDESRSVFIRRELRDLPSELVSPWYSLEEKPD